LRVEFEEKKVDTKIFVGNEEAREKEKQLLQSYRPTTAFTVSP